MLQLKNIKKDYILFDNVYNVLKGINLNFRNSEFVSILGPSGCGKTTMLNIIGGLDKYTSGDLIVNGKSTSKFNDSDFDTYRNHNIGFVFQNYNLIPHQSILKNVELALSISGISKKERRERAVEALRQVDLLEHMKKKPSQLSGGQCQRAAIARALVTNPSIILADEPTGALDNESSIGVMKLLKKISSDRLVIMVTHNPILAEEYSTRIVKMFDGMIIEDTNPLDESEIKFDNIDENNNKASMDISTSIKLSGSNLLCKKRRTLITSIACSIGIIGMSVILSVSSGMNDYVKEVEYNSSSFSYINIGGEHIDTNSILSGIATDSNEVVELPKYPSDALGIYPQEGNKMSLKSTQQIINKTYLDYVEKNVNGNTKDTNLSVGIGYKYKMNMNLIAYDGVKYHNVSTKATNGVYEEYYWNEIMSNSDYINTQYTVLATLNSLNPIPTKYNEVVLVVDEYNRVPTKILDELGIKYDDNLSVIKYEDILGKEFRLIKNDNFYKYEHIDSEYLKFNNIYTQEDLSNAYANGESIKIVSVIRQKSDAVNNWLSVGIGYTNDLVNHIINENANSKIVKHQQKHPKYDVFTGEAFAPSGGLGITDILGVGYSYEGNMMIMGAPVAPSSIFIYPKDFDSKDKIIEVLNNWNEKEIYNIYGYEKDLDGNFIADKYKVKYNDFTQIIASMLGDLINICLYALIAFSSISLIVSSIMIAIITYASVIERTKEIGTLRSLGARKKDIATVFLSESAIIGFVSGFIALIFTFIINFIINKILLINVGVGGIASFRWYIALIMFVLAVGLNLIASFIPAKMAANKNPVDALRSE